MGRRGKGARARVCVCEGVCVCVRVRVRVQAIVFIFVRIFLCRRNCQVVCRQILLSFWVLFALNVACCTMPACVPFSCERQPWSRSGIAQFSSGTAWWCRRRPPAHWNATVGFPLSALTPLLQTGRVRSRSANAQSATHPAAAHTSDHWQPKNSSPPSTHKDRRPRRALN